MMELWKIPTSVLFLCWNSTYLQAKYAEMLKMWEYLSWKKTVIPSDFGEWYLPVLDLPSWTRARLEGTQKQASDTLLYFM